MVAKDVMSLDSRVGRVGPASSSMLPAASTTTSGRPVLLALLCADMGRRRCWTLITPAMGCVTTERQTDSRLGLLCSGSMNVQWSSDHAARQQQLARPMPYVWVGEA